MSKKAMATSNVSYVVPEVNHSESKAVARRLSTPYHGLPSVIDYDPNTGYVTFGQLIEPPVPVVKPRKYAVPAMPTREQNPGVCRHPFCLTERRRLYGLAVPEQPVGLPWSTGLLKHLPGHSPKDEGSSKRKTRKKKKVDREKMCQKALAMDEMIHFYKIALLAGSVISAARKRIEQEQEGYDDESMEDKEVAEGETGGEKDKQGNKQDVEDAEKEETPIQEEQTEGEIRDGAQSVKGEEPENREKPPDREMINAPTDAGETQETAGTTDGTDSEKAGIDVAQGTEAKQISAEGIKVDDDGSKTVADGPRTSTGAS